MEQGQQMKEGGRGEQRRAGCRGGLWLWGLDEALGFHSCPCFGDAADRRGTDLSPSSSRHGDSRQEKNKFRNILGIQWRGWRKQVGDKDGTGGSWCLW